MIEIKKDIQKCIQCPHHNIEPDPDPNDWFCDDDIKIRCTLSPDPYRGNCYREPYITVGCRPYRAKKESDVPVWCPLKNESIEKENLLNKKVTNRELFLERFTPFLSAFGMERIYDAYRFAKYAHKEQYRSDGCRYVEHPRAVVKIIADELGIVNNWKLIVAALLHDVWEDTWLLTPCLTGKIFGKDIALWLSFLTREKEHNKEEFPKYIGKISESGIWQVVLIKVCDRLHNLRTLKKLDIERQKRYLRETETYFYDLAKTLIRISPPRMEEKMILLESLLISEISKLKDILSE